MSNLHAAGLSHVAPIELDERELRILSGYAHGRTDRQIADNLGCSRPGVSGAGTRLRKRLGAADRAHAVGIAYRTGILKADMS